MSGLLVNRSSISKKDLPILPHVVKIAEPRKKPTLIPAALVKCMMQLVEDAVNPVKSLSNREATSQFTVQSVFAVCEAKFLVINN